jgi:hypothetical protein
MVTLSQPKLVKENADLSDHVTVDIPLLIRLFELVREDVKTDVDVHNVVEKMISLKNKGVLTMVDYEEIASGNRGVDSGQQTADAELESIKKLAGI